METLLGELGKRLPKRWLAGVLVPGAVWVVVALAARHTGHLDALNHGQYTAWVAPLVHRLSGSSATAVATIVWLVAGALTSAWIAQVSAAGVQRLWLGRWIGPARGLARWIVKLRTTRLAVSANPAEHGSGRPPAYLSPHRPTWIGDRFALVDTRIYAQYYLCLALIWSRLWLLLNPDVRSEVRAARDRYDNALVLVGWSVPYLALAALSWPCAVIAAAIAVIGWRRTRAAAGALADSVEAVVDLHHSTLAAALGHPLPPEGITKEIADQINDQLNKGA